MTYNGDNDDDELAVIESIRRGDKPAMKQLYEQHAGYLAVVCSRYISSDADLWDVPQDSFVTIMTSVRQFEYRGRGSLKAWMTRIAINECLKFLRTKIRFSHISSMDELPEAIADDDTDIDPDHIPESVILDELRNLPVGYRTVFNLFVFEHKGHKEIARLLGIRESTSASQLYKAKKMLAHKLAHYKSELHG